MVSSVCFVMPNMSGGGAQRVVSVLANELVRLNWEVMLYLTNDALIEYQLNKKILIDTTCCDSSHGAKSQILGIRNKMRAHSDTTFVSFLDNQNVFTILAGIGLPNRVVVSQRNDPHKAYADRPYMRPIARHLYKYADAAVFQTNDALSYYPVGATGRYKVILNPLNEIIPQPFQGTRTHRIVTVCRLNEQKNLPLAIDAFEDFLKEREEHEDYVFEIYGKGELEEPLKRYVDDKQLTGKVLFKGFCSDVHTRILDAMMFVISSDYEGLSNAMLESMALGIPTVATDCPIGGARMVIKDGINGLLVPVRDKERLRDAMCRIADDRNLMEAISQQGQRIRSELSSSKIIKQWISVLEGKKEGR